MPRYFEANRGQWPAGQVYRAYGYGYGILLGTDGITLQLDTPKGAELAKKGQPSRFPGAIGQTAAPRELSLHFEDVSSASRLAGLDALAAKGAWFQGAEKDWHSGISLYQRVRESQIYPGVDATFYGRGGQLEYDLDLAPGARPNSLVFDLEGSDGVAIDKNGNLAIEVDGQQIVLHKPLAWQPDGQSRKMIDVSYAVLPAHGGKGERVGFDVAVYDKSKPLTIDPVLTFATYLSSSSSALPDHSIVDLALDSSNNVYVLSTDASTQSMTVQKLTSAGSLVYTATFSTTSGQVVYPSALRVSPTGQAYIAASAVAGYPTTSNAYQTTWPNASYSPEPNAALSVISADGSKLTYSTYFGGRANGAYTADFASGLAVDASGSAYLVGQAGGDNFPTTTGAYQATYSSAVPAGFVAKFDPSATGTASLTYSTLIGGSNTLPYAVAVDGSGDAYLAVYNGSCLYPAATSGAFSYSGNQVNNYCGYVTAINPSGTALVYSAYLGPGSPTAIAVDGSKNAYVAGNNIDSDDFPTTPGAYQTSYPDGFALELNPTGGLVYSTCLGLYLRPNDGNGLSGRQRS
jgi:hypothetical protein